MSIKISWKQLKDVGLILGSLSIVVISFLLIRFYPGKETAGKQVGLTDNAFISTSTPAEQTTIHELNLLSGEYTPPRDIFSNKTTYKNNLIKIALIGEFESVALKVLGNISNNKDNFVSLNIGNISGTLGGYRSGASSLDVGKTTGVFNKQNLMDFTLDLMNSIRLSTTKEEFLKTFQPYKEVIFWDKIKPPAHSGRGTISDLLIAPYNEDGIYGEGVKVRESKLIYTCKGKSDACKMMVCDKSKGYIYGSECLKDNFEKDFGKTSWESYAEFFN